MTAPLRFNSRSLLLPVFFLLIGIFFSILILIFRFRKHFVLTVECVHDVGDKITFIGINFRGRAENVRAYFAEGALIN